MRTLSITTDANSGSDQNMSDDDEIESDLFFSKDLDPTFTQYETELPRNLNFSIIDH